MAKAPSASPYVPPAEQGAAYNLISRHVVLQPVRPPYADYLCERALTGEFFWQWGGRAESPDAFRDSLWQGVLCQYVAVQRAQNRPMGVVRATAANFLHGFAYLSWYFDREHRLQALPIESIVLFISHLFQKYGFRNLYGEMLEPHFDLIASGEGEFFIVEGRLRGYAFQDGRHVDKVLVTVPRSLWESRAADLLAMISVGSL